MSAQRDAAESQALALVIEDQPGWRQEIVTNRETAAGWAALSPEIQAAAEAAYPERFGRPFPKE